MIAIIQCSKGKQEDAGRLTTLAGTPVMFVAHPELAPPNGQVIYAHPDGDSDRPGLSWRDVLVQMQDNDNLCCAGELYSHPRYYELAEYIDEDKFYILSAGWGL